MKPEKEQDDLRRRAEEKLDKRPADSGRESEDPQFLLHELHVHHVELEMQNEELRRTREEIEASLQRYTEIFDFAPTGYFVLTPDGVIHELNLAGARLLRQERGRLVGRSFIGFIFEGQQASFREFLGRVLAHEPGEMTGETFEVALVGDRAELREIRVTATVVAGKEPAALCAAEDVTVRKFAEAALREEARNKDAFLAVLSHELRNPLAPIRNSLFLLSRAEPGGEQARSAIEVIDRQVTHLTRIVDDLLDVTRIARGKVRLDLIRLELGHLVRRTLEDHRPGFQATGISLQERFDNDPFWVDADPGRMVQVVGNLLGNALKFTSRGGSVEVFLRREGKRVALSVRDTGMGIAPELRERLFEPFRQAPQALDRRSGGLGLGLAMVKGLVELHGGTVDIVSRGLGQGAEFIVRLPAAAGPLPTNGRPVRHPMRPRRVLVIEDDADGAESLRQVLEIWGHDVRVARDGTAGLALAGEFRPEIVLCDIGLPGMDGYALATALRKDRQLQQTFLVAISGYALGEDVKRALAAGFDRHLAKPSSAEKLAELFGEIPERS